jgi:hypothetical protein
MAYPVKYDYRSINPNDRLITDADTGTIIGLRNDQEQNMVNGVSDNMSGVGGALTAIAGRNIVIPTSSQALVVGGVTISSGSITCGGEFVAIAY